MSNEPFIAYGGQRGGGKIFFLEQKVARLQEELKAAMAERDMYAGEIAKVCITDDIIRNQMVIRINYVDLVDPCVAMNAIIRELQKIIKP